MFVKNSLKSSLKDFIVNWNNRFILDRKFRKDNNIVFNSQQHRSTSQIDIYLNYYEDFLIEKYLKDKKRIESDLQDYKDTGEFLKERFDDFNEDDFDLTNKLQLG